MSDPVSIAALCAAIHKDIDRCKSRAKNARQEARQCDWREKRHWREVELGWLAQVKALERTLKRLETNG